MTDNTVHQPADISAANERAQEITRALRAIIRDLTGWDVWASDKGALYATRVARITDAEVEQGMARTVSGDDALDIVEKIRRDLQTTASRLSKPEHAGL